MRLPPIFAAIDTAEFDHARKLVDAVKGSGVGIKLGLEFFSKFGQQGVRVLSLAYYRFSWILNFTISRTQSPAQFDQSLNWNLM